MVDDDNRADRDVVWEAAWSWVLRHHDMGTLDASIQNDFAGWLAIDPIHRRAYERASRIWLLTGLLPPESDIVVPDGSESEGD